MRKKAKPRERELLFTLTNLDTGMQKGKVAQALGISPAAVSQVLKRHPRG